MPPSEGFLVSAPRETSSEADEHDEAHDSRSAVRSPFKIGAAISDRYGLRILMATTAQGRTAVELSRACDIPIAACYRRIKTLSTLGLLEREPGPYGRNGRPQGLFRSRVVQLRVELEKGVLRTHVEFQPESAVRIRPEAVGK